MLPSTLKTLATCLSAFALSGLAACGGTDGSDDPGTNDVAQPYTVSTMQSQPIVHTFTEPGRYTLTLTGDYEPSTPFGADALSAWFSFSGQGSITSGDAEPSISIPASSGPVHIRETISADLIGSGPWQVALLTSTAFASGTMTGLTLTTSKR